MLPRGEVLSHMVRVSATAGCILVMGWWGWNRLFWLFLWRSGFWAHLCICMVGSYASLSVRLMSLDQNSRLENNSYLRKYVCLSVIARCQSANPWVIGRCAHFNVKLHFWYPSIDLYRSIYYLRVVGTILIWGPVIYKGGKPEKP